MSDTATPKRWLYKAAEVCEIARLQPYVLRTWEAEFPNLGVTRPGGARVYRQADLDQVLRIKRLVVDEGLTLAGVRRRLESEETPQPDLPLEDLVAPAARERIKRIREGLQDLLNLLAPVGSDQSAPAMPSGGAASASAEAAAAVPSAPGEPALLAAPAAAESPAPAPEGADAGSRQSAPAPGVPQARRKAGRSKKS